MTYVKTEWQTGDIITAEKLNKIEDGIANAKSSGGSGDFDIKGFLEGTITEAVIPEDVTVIRYHAFTDCTSLASVEMPNVTEIGEYAFAGCTLLSQVVINNINPPVLGSRVFSGCHENLKIYVPASAINTYKAASGWSNYADKIEAIQE